MKTTFLYFLKIIFYFILFFKIVYREPQINNVKNFEKQKTNFKLHKQIDSKTQESY